MEKTSQYPAFQYVVNTLPGASHIGQHWEKDPRVLIKFTNSGVENPHGMFDIIPGTFPSATSGEPTSYGEVTHIIVAPRIAGELLILGGNLTQDGDSTTLMIDLDGAGLSARSWLPSLACAEPSDVVNAVAAIIAAEPEMDFDDAANMCDELFCLAQFRNVHWRHVFELCGPFDSVDVDALDAIIACAQPA